MQPAAWRPTPIDWLFLLAIFFPYLQIIPIGTDVQPIGLCVAILVLLLDRRWHNAPRQLWLFGFLFVVALCVLITGEIDFGALRSVGNYASLFLISLASYSCAPRIQPLTRRLLIISIWIWFAIGFIQSVYSVDFLTNILPDVRRSDSRGVVSLAPEPGYYATMCLFFLFILYLHNRERSIHGLLCIVQITLLARSTLFTGILLAIVLVYGTVHLNPRKMLAVVAVLVAGWAIATQTEYFENTRTGDLTKLALANPFGLTKLDLSISDRVAQLVFSLKGALDNHLMPNGFTSWGAYYHAQTLGAAEYFLMYYPNPFPTRIQSGIGAPLYELGFFGFIPVWTLIIGIKNRFGTIWSGSALALLFAITLSLLPGTPIATPIYGFLVGQLFAFRPARTPREALNA